MKKTAFLIAIILCLAAIVMSCGGNKNGKVGMTTSGVQPIEIDELPISEYVTLCEYKGLTFEYLPAQEEPSEIIWEKIYFESTIHKYPEQQVEYYIDQIRAQYIYVAQERGDTFQNVIDSLGVTDATMLKEAQFKTAADLIRRAVIEAEGIELTEEDKTNHADKYIERCAKDYGYTEEYIRENLMDEIYDIMLEEKMMEKLVLLNTFVEVGQQAVHTH